MLKPTTAHTITIWVIEDEPGYRTTLKDLLDNVSGMNCAFAFEDCESVLDMLSTYEGRARPWNQPDVLMLDINLPGLNGIEGIGALKTHLTGTRIVMLTINDDAETIYAAFQAGASGYLFKNSSVDQIIDAIRQAALGGLLMPAPVADKVLRFFQQAPSGEDPGLTEREKEVLREMAKGYSQKEIATRLFISPHTVNAHVRNIYEKIHVRCAAEAVAVAIRKKWI